MNSHPQQQPSVFIVTEEQQQQEKLAARERMLASWRKAREGMDKIEPPCIAGLLLSSIITDSDSTS